MSLYHTPSALEASLLRLKSHSLHNHPIAEKESEREQEKERVRDREVEVRGGQRQKGNPAEQKKLASVFID